MLDGAGDDAVGDTGEGARGVVLAVGEVGDARDEGLVAVGAALLEEAARGVEGAELDGYARADAEERDESALVEGESALVLVDGGGGGKGAGVLCGGLQTDFDDVEGLAFSVLAFLNQVKHDMRSETYQSTPGQYHPRHRRRDPWPSGDRRSGPRGTRYRQRNQPLFLFCISFFSLNWFS